MSNQQQVVFSSLCRYTIVFLLCVAPLGTATAGDAEFEESDVKAAFLYYFFHYIYWPEKSKHDADHHIDFCATADGPVTNSLKLLLASPKAAATAARITIVLTPEQLTACDYVYIDSATESSIQNIFENTRGKPILVVSDLEGFASMGGMIELKTNASRISVLINLETMAAQGLIASSKLLNLAIIILNLKWQHQQIYF